MPLPSIYDTAERYLFADLSVMEGDGVPPLTIRHVLRIRDAYNHWLSYPTKPEREIVDRLINLGVGKSQAYVDLKIVKSLLGSLNKESKAFQRYQAKQMAMETYEKAKKAGDWRTMAQVIKTVGDIFDLKNEDERDDIFSQIMIQPFEYTSDPTVAGFKPIPNVREKIRKKLDQYSNEEVQDVEFEDIEFNEDKIFHPDKHGN
jgi:phenylalanyl-tRNA synthetase alpha subunit